MRRIIALLLLGLWGWCGPAPAAAPGMRILLFGDPQVKSEQDLDYFRRDIVEPLRGRRPKDIDDAMIREALERFEGNLSAAARHLGVARNTLYRRMGCDY